LIGSKARQVIVTDALVEESGFDDWVRVDKRFWTFYSPAQHELIQQVGQVVWLTTWAKHPDMLDDYTWTTKFGPFETAETDVGRWNGTHNGGWWKAWWAVALAEERPDVFEGIDEVVWVDDDHDGYPKFTGQVQVFARMVEDLYGAKTRVIRPDVVWTRESLESLL
jgi:hypothetical protein